MEPFVFNQSADVPYFSLSPWEREFSHLTVGFSAKKQDMHWGYSNYALHVGENAEQVIRNRKQLAKKLDMPFSGWTSSEQVHGTIVAIVSHDDRGRGDISRESSFCDTDGLVTCEVDTLLATYYADCVPLYFYSPDIDMIGTAHAGWKGTVNNIVRNIIGTMISNGAKTENIRTAIGPANSYCCYVVDEKVIKPFIEIVPDEKKFQRALKKCDFNQWNFDLKEANRLLMEQAGVLPENISVSSWCTSCHADYFHSHRRDKGNTGRMVAWIGKKS